MLFNIHKTAQRADVSDHTVWTWVHAGLILADGKRHRLPACIVGRAVHVKDVDLSRFLKLRHERWQTRLER